MKVKLAKTRGFCYGVKKAVQLAENAPSNLPLPIHTLGPLIHNKYEIEHLHKVGVSTVDSTDNIVSGTVIVRTHGLPRETLNLLQNKGVRIIDATCPFVKKIQNLVKSLSENGYCIVVIGEKSHPEVKALVSYVKGPIKVINDLKEISGLSNGKKIAVVSQSTQTTEKFDRIVNAIKRKFNHAEIFNTICTASAKRQKEAEELAGKVDMILVIGGRNSANTRHLASLCKKYVPTHHIESVNEIDNSWFADIKSVGITAGASTPEKLISEILTKIKEKDW
jgi:4-hydroxy-3-methylbut-2-enyl diphosphate reductase